MIPFRMLTEIARWLTLTTVFTPSSVPFQAMIVGLLLAALIVVWLRRNVVLARLRLVGPHA